MTLVSDIIHDAFRQGNLIAVNAAVTQPMSDEAMRYLQRIVSSTFGAEVGDPLTAFPLGRTGIERPSNYPGWDQNPGPEWFVPKNTRVMLNLDSGVDLYLHPAPDGGTRFAVNDVAGTLAAGPVTVHGNGRLIEGQPSLVLDENGFEGEWFYRDDIGSWARISPLTEGDIFPFPPEFDDFFITMLAIRLNPAYGIGLDELSQSALARARTQLRARYKQNVPVMPELGTILLTRTSRNSRDWESSRWGWGQPNLGDFPNRRFWW